ncbi:MAG: hypothetical protein ACK40L_15405, partial [Hydrogenophaga sp.]
MQISLRLLSLALTATLLAACGKQEEAVAPVPAKPETKLAQPAEEQPLRGAPDFGGTTQVAREAD